MQFIKRNAFLLFSVAMLFFAAYQSMQISLLKVRVKQNQETVVALRIDRDTVLPDGLLSGIDPNANE